LKLPTHNFITADFVDKTDAQWKAEMKAQGFICRKSKFKGVGLELCAIKKFEKGEHLLNYFGELVTNPAENDDKYSFILCVR
jgi:hypothetical protein